MAHAEHSGRLTAEWLAFYGDDGGRTPSGYTLRQVLEWPDGEWEDRHDFIQWVFPTDEPSMYNSNAPVLDAATVARFRADPLMRDRLRRAFDRWLSFCGVARTADGLTFGHPNPDVWGRANHNWLRITRVLRSLNLLGLPDEARVFFDLLATVRGTTDLTTWRYWEVAALPTS
jgi:hypothetical protein